MTANEFRQMALVLPGAIESAHMNHPDFRVEGKIFASLGYPDAEWGMVKLTPAQQRAFMKKSSGAFRPCNGAWGERGSTTAPPHRLLFSILQKRHWHSPSQSATLMTLSGMKLLLTLTALFATIWSTIAAPTNATYSGLFSDPANISQQSCGEITLSVTSNESFSGKIQINSTRASFTGVFQKTEHISEQPGSTTIYFSDDATVTLKTRSGTLTLEMTIYQSATSPFISGTISDGTWTAQLFAERAGFDGKSSIAPQAGRYTLLIPQTQFSATKPAGSGYGTVVVTKAGRVKVAAALADGTKISQGSTLSSIGDWPLYVSLYGNRGLAMGWDSCVQSNLSGNFTWIKPASSKAKYYPAGFISQTFIAGASYRVPTNASPLTWTNGNLSLGGGNLEKSFGNHVSIDSKGRVKNLSENKLTLTFNRTQGTFRGTVTPPGGKKSISFAGGVMQNYDMGNGYFLGQDQSGIVWLTGTFPDAASAATPNLPP